MPKTLLFFCFLLLSVSLFGQTRFGAKALFGVLTPRAETVLVGDEDDFVIHEVRYVESNPIISFGGFHQSMIGWLFVQTDLMYSANTMKYDVSSIVNEELVITRMQEKFHFIDFQVAGGVTQNSFRLGVGPVFQYVLRHDDGLTEITTYINKLRKLQVSFSAILGYDYGPFSFDFKYQRGLRTIGDHIYWGPYKSRFRGRPDILSVSVGYFFNQPF